MSSSIPPDQMNVIGGFGSAPKTGRTKMRNRHTDSGKFMPGKSTGVYRGQMKHGRAVEAFKDALHTEPSRTPVVRHGDCPSVGTPETLADVSSKGATTFGGPKSNG